MTQLESDPLNPSAAELPEANILDELSSEAIAAHIIKLGMIYRHLRITHHEDYAQDVQFDIDLYSRALHERGDSHLLELIQDESVVAVRGAKSVIPSRH